MPHGGGVFCASRKSTGVAVPMRRPLHSHFGPPADRTRFLYRRPPGSASGVTEDSTRYIFAPVRRRAMRIVDGSRRLRVVRALMATITAKPCLHFESLSLIVYAKA